MKKQQAQIPLLPGMGAPVFGGVQLTPMETGKGGWDLFRPYAPVRGQQSTIWDVLDSVSDNDLGPNWKAAHDRRTALLRSRLKIGYDPDETGNCRKCGEAGRCHCGQTDAEWDARRGGRR